ncbi:uncharacterized protein LOC121386705 [Gigantopelta aegis]|uniref:uncharacterized protein LOC121386705 n=1 Tax=Gigantopelta aegis TaxID=1735272 RepID=UPI001B88B5B9|nr:uncharacterized protein LOC121386705 [Gigantopelta aegis]
MATNVGGSAETCGICLNKFNHPKLLPCFHTFCCECLEEFVSKSSQNGRFHCPACRYEMTLPEGGVTKFQTNFYVEARAVKHAHNNDVNCDVCEHKASHVCHECEFALCESCVKYHKSIPVTKSHSLIQLGDQSKDKSFVVREAYCVKHSSEKLRFYCSLCGKVICLHCKLTAHEGHKTEDICDVVATARSSLVETKEKLEKYLPGIKKPLEMIHSDHANALSACDSVSDQINTFADHLVERINKIRTKAMERLKDERQRSAKEFTGAKELMQSHEEFLNCQIAHITDLLTHGLDCDVLTADAEMRERLIEVQNMDLEVSITHESRRSASEANSTYLFLLELTLGDVEGTKEAQRLRALPPSVTWTRQYLDRIGCDVNDFVMTLLKRVTEYQVEADVLSRFSCDGNTIRSISFSESNKALIVVEANLMSLCEFDVNYNLLQCTREGVQERIHISQNNYENDDTLTIMEKRLNPDSFDNEWKVKDEIPDQYSDDLYEEYLDNTSDTPGLFGSIKKQFPFGDCLDNGDECSIDVNKQNVIITLNNGMFRTLCSNPFAAPYEEFRPEDVCWGTHNEIYIVDAGSSSVLVYSLEEGFQKALTIPMANVCPSAVAMDTDQQLWIGDVRGNVYVCNVY